MTSDCDHEIHAHTGGNAYDLEVKANEPTIGTFIACPVRAVLWLTRAILKDHRDLKTHDDLVKLRRPKADKDQSGTSESRAFSASGLDPAQSPLILCGNP